MRVETKAVKTKTPAGAPAGETMTLARFLAGLRFEDLPADVVKAAKIFTLDLIGATLGAVKTEETRIAVDVFRELGGREECTVLGFGFKTACHNAAYLNSLMSHVLELDDTHRDSMTHVGAPVIPAALAIAEREGRGGRTLLAAVVAGYEACLRVANAVQPGHWYRGFLSMGTCGTFGAAAAAGHCLGFDADKLANGFGLAGMQAASLNSSIFANGDMGKRLSPSHAASAGVFAALMANKGFTGTTTVLEGVNGFCRSFTDRYDLARVTDRLGEAYEITRTSLKPYSCCRFNHAPLDGVMAIVREEKLAAEHIESIRIGTYQIAVINRPHRAKPQSLFDAKMSIPFSIAVAILKGGVGEKDFTADTVADPAYQALAARVRIVEDEAETRIFPKEWPARVVIRTTDGHVFERRVPFPKGEPEAPMTDAEVHAKFTDLATEAVSASTARAIIDEVENLDKRKTLDRLLSLLAGARTQTH
jgi:2-methylcitrate dehydratase PrpD